MIFFVASFAARFFESELERVHGITRDNNPKLFRLVVYIFWKARCHRFDDDPEGTVLAQRFVEDEFGSRLLSKLIYEESQKPNSLFVLETDYSQCDHLARSYSVNESFFYQFLQISTRKYAESIGQSANFVDLFTGKLKKSFGKLHYLYSSSRNLMTSTLVRDSLNSIKELPFNKLLFEQHILQQKPKLRVNWCHVTLPDGRKFRFPPIVKQLPIEPKARKSLMRDMAVYANITMESDSKYQPVYNPAYTGRVYEIPAGFQNSKRLTKAVIAHKQGLWNYDIVSCHLNILILELRRYEQIMQGSSIKPLAMKYHQGLAKQIINKTKMKAQAAAFNVPVDDFKIAILSYLYCGSCYADPIKAAKKFGMTTKEFKKYVTPLKMAREKLWEYICNDSEHLVAGTKNFKTVIVNKAGCKFHITSDMTSKDLMNKLLAHVIQGIEKFFIHTLILECSKNGIPVVADEHDGIITKKAIPAHIFDDVRASTGYNLEVVEKPFDREQETRDYIDSLIKSGIKTTKAALTLKIAENNKKAQVLAGKIPALVRNQRSIASKYFVVAQTPLIPDVIVQEMDAEVF